MGIENHGTKPAHQGEAGFLTQEQLDEMNESPVETNTSPELVTAAPSPEGNAEGLNQHIEKVEAELRGNVMENESLMSALETKMGGSDNSEPETQSKKLLTLARISDAYEAAEDKINTLSLLLATAGGLTISGAFFTGAKSYELSTAGDASGAEQMAHLGTHLVEGGLGVAVAAGAAWVIATAINKLKQHIAKNKVYNASNSQTT
jgi:hypothetical protein